jgi:hypothetical protein
MVLSLLNTRVLRGRIEISEVKQRSASWMSWRGCPGSFWKAALVVEEFGVIEVGTLDVRGGALGDGTQLFDGGFTASALKTPVGFLLYHDLFFFIMTRNAIISR